MYILKSEYSHLTEKISIKRVSVKIANFFDALFTNNVKNNVI